MKTEDLSPEELQRLLEAMETDPNAMAASMLNFVLFTGLRRSEVFRLKWADINFDRGFLLIRDPKGKKDENIPLSDPAQELLLKLERPYPNSSYVFPGDKGNQRTDCKAAPRIRDRAGLPKDFRPFHGLRHVYAYDGKQWKSRLIHPAKAPNS